MKKNARLSSTTIIRSSNIQYNHIQSFLSLFLDRESPPQKSMAKFDKNTLFYLSHYSLKLVRWFEIFVVSKVRQVSVIFILKAFNMFSCEIFGLCAYEACQFSARNSKLILPNFFLARNAYWNSSTPRMFLSTLKGIFTGNVQTSPLRFYWKVVKSNLRCCPALITCPI